MYLCMSTRCDESIGNQASSYRYIIIIISSGRDSVQRVSMCIESISDDGSILLYFYLYYILDNHQYIPYNTFVIRLFV